MNHNVPSVDRRKEVISYLLFDVDLLGNAKRNETKNFADQGYFWGECHIDSSHGLQFLIDAFT
jgi:hypothetical protein